MKIRDRITDFRRVKASELLPNPKNWRTHPTEQADAMRGVLAEVGIADALLVRETPHGLQIVDGHLRADVDAEVEWPVLVLDVNDAEADMLLATHDPLAAMAGTDAELLSSLLDEIETSNEALQEMLDGMADDAGLIEPPEIEEDEPPEPPADPVTKPGDLWILGEHRLLCGDATNAEDVARLMDGAKAAICFTSPPYSEQRKDHYGGIPADQYVDWWQPIQDNVRSILADNGSFFVNIKPHCDKLDRSLYVFDLVIAHVRLWGWHFAEEFCWERVGIPQQVIRRFKNQFEPVYQFAKGSWSMYPEQVQYAAARVPVPMGKGRAGDTNAAKRQGIKSAVADNDVVAGLAYPGNRLPPFSSEAPLGHPAVFPVGLPSFFVRAFTVDKEPIYDPFLGSGTTLIAAEQLNRRGFGLEISPAYCDVICKRWENLTGKKATR